MELTITLFDRLLSLGTRRNVILGVILIVLFNTVFFPGFSRLNDVEPVADNVLDLKLSYSVQEAYELLERLGPHGREEYIKSTLVVDFPYLLFYSVLYAVFMALAVKWARLDKSHFWRKLIYIPFLVGLLDVLENIGTLTLAEMYPAKLPGIVHLASLATSLKWLFAGVAVTLLVVLLLRGVVLSFSRTGQG